MGWGSKVIDKISKAIREKYPEKRGYSPRNLKYMCQFARLYPLGILGKFLFADKELEVTTIEKVISATKALDEYTIGQEAPTQIKDITEMLTVVTHQNVTQIETDFICSPVSKINWASHMVLLDSKLPLGVRYWDMKQTVEFGWSSDVLSYQISIGNGNRFRLCCPAKAFSNWQQ